MTEALCHLVVLRSAGNIPEKYIRYRRPLYPSALYLDGLLPYFVFEFDEYDVECVNLTMAVLLYAICIVFV